MPANVIRETLILDYTDTTAAAVAAAYPTLFPMASSVPNYLYQSLATLLGTPASALPTLVVADLGEGKTPATAAIVLETTDICESVLDPSGMLVDEPGAEYATIGIKVQNVRTTTSVSLVKSVSLRIRYLIDYNLRESRITAPDLTVTGDTSILPDWFKVFWIKSGVLTASECYSQFRCEYLRAFPYS